MSEPKYTYTCDIFSASIHTPSKEIEERISSIETTIILQLDNGARAVFRAIHEEYPTDDWKNLWSQLFQKHMAYLPVDMSIKYLNMERPSLIWEVHHVTLPGEGAPKTTIMVTPQPPISSQKVEDAE